MAGRKEDKAADEPQVALEKAGPVVPVVQGGGEGEVDAKENPALHELRRGGAAAVAWGFSGVAADPPPDRHYTVEGVLAGKPTPETNGGAL